VVSFLSVLFGFFLSFFPFCLSSFFFVSFLSSRSFLSLFLSFSFFSAHTIATASSELFPLLHFVLDDLPTKSRSPKLDDANARNLASVVHCLSLRVMLPKILSFLVASNFLSPPSRAGAEPLPAFEGHVVKMEVRKI